MIFAQETDETTTTTKKRRILNVNNDDDPKVREIITAQLRLAKKRKHLKTKE